jgi:CRISPR-associated protein Cas2
MNVLVAYDVNTLTREGRSRLRRVMKACKNYGQRVQFSVFECSVNEVQFERLRQRLRGIMNEDEDNLRIYHLKGERDQFVECYGRNLYLDFEKPLIV